MSTSRRQFLSLASAAPLLGVPWAHATRPPEKAKLLVLVYLKGGNDSYNTVVPYTSERYAKLRPNIAIKRDQVIRINDTHAFHPALAPLLPMWEAKEIALLQGIGQQEITNQHYRDLEMQFTGAGPDQYLNDGWVTRALTATKSTGALDALAFGDLDIRVSDPMGPFRGDRLRVVNMQHPSEWLNGHRVEGTQYLTSAPALEIAKSFVQRDPISLKTTFPADEFGDALKATVQLAAAGMVPPVVHITINASNGDHHDAFDTHWNQLKFHGAALGRLAGGLAAFRAGMREIGQWDRTLVATYDEFGRCPKENADKGTHHGWSSVHFVTGGRIKGGLFGEPMPVIDVFAIDGPPPVIDYRSLYTTIIQDWWGASSRGVFDRAFKPLDLLRA
jgi:uncharacterized protein (DUF1501 family)